jgi:hypothetical protein
VSDQSFEKRLDKLACQLTVADDVVTVLAIRAEVLAIKATLAAQVLRAQRAMRRRARLIRGARLIRRRAELIAGELLLVMRDSGHLKKAGFQTGAGANQKSLADLGLWWATAARWEARARRAHLNSYLS